MEAVQSLKLVKNTDNHYSTTLNNELKKHPLIALIDQWMLCLLPTFLSV